MWGRDKNFQVLMLYELSNCENKISLTQFFCLFTHYTGEKQIKVYSEIIKNKFFISENVFIYIFIVCVGGVSGNPVNIKLNEDIQSRLPCVKNMTVQTG